MHFGTGDEGTALENFNGKEIMDASWGEEDYGEEDQEEDEAPWGQTERKPQGFLHLPEEENLKEREQVSEACATAAQGHCCCVLRTPHVLTS